MRPQYSEAEKRRDLYLRRTYSISLEEYRAILALQGDSCVICKKPLEGISHAVDHDHKTGVIRGILCAYCNHWNLGRHTDADLVQRMADYLREPPAVKAIGERKTPKKSSRKRRATRTTRSRGTEPAKVSRVLSSDRP